MYACVLCMQGKLVLKGSGPTVSKQVDDVIGERQEKGKERKEDKKWDVGKN